LDSNHQLRNKTVGAADFAGLAIWQFQDVKVDCQNSSVERPGGINNKGVLSQFREPKLAASAVGSVYKKGSQVSTVGGEM
jgi:hypothetical protein